MWNIVFFIIECGSSIHGKKDTAENEHCFINFDN